MATTTKYNIINKRTNKVIRSVDAVSDRQALMIHTIDMTKEEVEGMSKAQKTEFRGKLYGLLNESLEAVKEIDKNQGDIFAK